MCSSAAEAHLLPGSTYCALRYNILHTLVVTSNYLSYCCLSIISNHSAGYLCYQAIEQVYLLKWPVSIYIYIYIYTVGTESIQTPLHFSLFVILQPFAKII